MRPLLVFVLGESLVLALLAALWWSGPMASGPTDAPRPHQTPADAASPPAEPVEVRTGSPVPLADRAPVERRAADVPEPPMVADDPVGILLTGRVLGPDGAPVPDAGVALRRGRESRAGNAAAGSGRYAVAGLQPGEWQLTCRAEGFAAHAATVTLDQRAFQQLDLELQRNHVLRVRVQDGGGRPVAEELFQRLMFAMPYVLATEMPLPDELPPTTSSQVHGLGVAEWRSLFDLQSGGDAKLRQDGWIGELRLNRPPPVHAALMLRTTVLQSQRIEPGQQELVFTLSPDDVFGRLGKVALRLVDAGGAPIVGAVVGLETAQGGGAANRTDDAGRTVIEDALPGLGILSARVGGEREGLYRFVRVPAGATIDLGDIALAPAVAIAGRVVGSDGKPVGGATVCWTELEARTFPQPLVTNRVARSDAEGRFALHQCGRHRYVVTVRARDGTAGFAQVDATRGAPPEPTITLSATTAVTLRSRLGLAEGCSVTALAADRLPVAVAWLADSRNGGMSLVPGSYVLEVHDLRTDRLLRTVPLQVGGEPLTLEVP